MTAARFEDLVALVRLARHYGLDVIGFAPPGEGAEIEGILPLITRTALPQVPGPNPAGDAWTAIVFAFHDHDWEEFLLPRALGLQAFYHGAVGSRRTHHARIDALRAAGVPAAHIDALRGSIGMRAKSGA